MNREQLLHGLRQLKVQTGSLACLGCQDEDNCMVASYVTIDRNGECDSISFASIDLGLKTKQQAEPAAESGPPQNRGRAQ